MNQWLRTWQPHPKASVRLFCLPHAGGGASTYRAWPALSGASVEIVGVQLPGREDRLREVALTDFDTVVDSIWREMRPAVDRPYALFGHSLGGRLAFALAHRGELEGLAPARVIVSGIEPPRAHDDAKPLTDAQLLDLMVDLGGTEPELLASSIFLEMVLPAMRADFALLRSQDPHTVQAVSCPVLALGGESDPTTPGSTLRQWRDLAYGPFELRFVPGDHFFVRSQLKAVVDLVIRSLVDSGPDPASPAGLAFD